MQACELQRPNPAGINQTRRIYSCWRPTTISKRWVKPLLATTRYESRPVSKTDELCIQNEKRCIQNEELCIKNKELCISNDELCRAGPR